ncbi:MAG TPA: alkaline phosphatase family protein [Edaphobacter sp.]
MKKICPVLFWIFVSAFLHAQGNEAPHRSDPASEHVLVVMTDGLRWQEVFGGADASLLTKENTEGQSIDDLRQRYVRATPEESRHALMPFLWNQMVPQGEIYGNRKKGSDAYVTNGLNFSYPGYSETLTGHPDAGVKSNDNVPNPNVTVLEWLNTEWKKSEPSVHDQTAAFGAWEVIGGVVNRQRCDFVVNVGYEPLTSVPVTPRVDLLNRWKSETPHIWEDEAFDAPTFYSAMEYLKAKRPRLLFLSLGETDDWAHGGRYGFYLDAAHRVDLYLEELWKFVQEDPEYRGHTTLIFLPDHGRGEAPDEWKTHGEKVPDSKYIFLAAMGGGVPARGELGAGTTAVTQSQVAATIARLFGKDWNRETPQAGKPLAEIR